MTAVPYFHVGILVADLESAIKRFSDVLQVDFASPVYQDCERFEEAGRVEPLRLRLTYSIQGPPYYELIEAQGNGLYGLHHGEGLHHVGMWEPDSAGLLMRLRAKGMTKEAVQYRPDGTIIVAFLDPGALHGVRIEIADQGLKEGHEAWLAGGEFIR
jgi:catechol 2,3-dioxygenase-like lactoylglutathione lyase family enzyme